MNGVPPGPADPVGTIWHPATQDSHPASPAGQLEVPEHGRVDGGRASVFAGVFAGVRKHFRRARAVRELTRLIRSAPTATVRNDLMTIAARTERFS